MGTLESFKSIARTPCPIVAGSQISPELRIVRAQACRALVKLDNFTGIRTICVQVHQGNESEVAWLAKHHCFKREPGCSVSPRAAMDGPCKDSTGLPTEGEAHPSTG